MSAILPTTETKTGASGVVLIASEDRTLGENRTYVGGARNAGTNVEETWDATGCLRSDGSIFVEDKTVFALP